MQVDADDIIRFEFIGDRAVTYAGDHGCQGFALFHEILGADRIVEAFPDNNIREFDTATDGIGWHGLASVAC